jgi:hypothetical protein
MVFFCKYFWLGDPRKNIYSLVSRARSKGRDTYSGKYI